MSDNPTKKCSRCKKTSPIADFYKDRSTKSGYAYYCKACERSRRSLYYANNRTRCLEWMAEYRSSNRDLCDAATAGSYNSMQARTLPFADNSRKEWTGPELELVLREDLSNLQLALMLKRSYRAVTDAKAKSKKLPRERFLSGKWTSELA